MEKKRVHVTVSGRVQGVCFRSATQQQARLGNVSGWVRNCPDGTVEAVFEGDPESVDSMVAWCHEGPSFASVSGVQAAEEPYRGEFSSFSITY